MPDVKIGPEFFQKEKHDYSNWYWAWVREICQNSIDAGSNTISMTIDTVDGNTIATVVNNGTPMTKEILEDKLLTLGESGKNFAGTVGGFGKAKIVLYYSHKNYEITSGDLHIVGSGGSYEYETGEYVKGTKSVVNFGEDCTDKLCEQIRLFAYCCQWRGSFYLNGERLETNLKKGAKRRELGWATIYTNKSASHRLVVRVDGMPMFVRYCSVDRCVVVEVERSSGEAFQANRDNLKFEYRSKLDAFFDQLATDSSTALRGKSQTQYIHFKGQRQEMHRTAMHEIISQTAAYATVPQAPAVNHDEDATYTGSERKVSPDDTPIWTETAQRQVSQTRVGLDFIIKNETGLQIPQYYLPGDFSAYSGRLCRIWVKVLREIYVMFGESGEFSVGFLFDESREAESERTDEYGQVYYINPTVVVQQACSSSRSLKKRWKIDNNGKYMLVMVALHEFVHGQKSLHPHDERYANKLTDLAGLVLANKQRFAKCFR